MVTKVVGSGFKTKSHFTHMLRLISPSSLAHLKSLLANDQLAVDNILVQAGHFIVRNIPHPLHFHYEYETQTEPLRFAFTTWATRASQEQPDTYLQLGTEQQSRVVGFPLYLLPQDDHYIYLSFKLGNGEGGKNRWFGRARSAEEPRSVARTEQLGTDLRLALHQAFPGPPLTHPTIKGEWLTLARLSLADLAPTAPLARRKKLKTYVLTQLLQAFVIAEQLRAESFTESPPFFRPADLQAFQHRLHTNPHYNSQVDHQIAHHLKSSIFAPTAYWVKQVANRLPFPVNHVVRQQWEQGHYFRRYSWGRLFLPDYPDKGFYITLGVDSGETERVQALVSQHLVPAGPALILKVDVHTAPNSNLSPEARQVGHYLVDELPLPSRWRRIGLEELTAYSWPRLIQESVDFITQHEPILHQLWAASDKPRQQVAKVGPGKTVALKTGKVPVDIAQRETEANDEHRRLSNLLQSLLPTYDFTKVANSCPIHYGIGKSANEIDMVASDKQGRTTFFEIKALPSLDKCIREALGQLLEYTYWEAAPSPHAQRLVIASPHPLTPPARRYLQRLQQELNLFLGYVQIDVENKQLLFFEH
jgi:hypothetical protein